MLCENGQQIFRKSRISLQISRRFNGDMEQVPYLRHRNIRRFWKLRRLGHLAPRIYRERWSNYVWSRTLKKRQLNPELGCSATKKKFNTTDLTFRGPCIVLYSYDKSQRDALFLKFILVKNSTCFGQIYCPSSGVLILYSQQLVFVILVMLTVC